jgi:hypothetical protein
MIIKITATHTITITIMATMTIMGIAREDIEAAATLRGHLPPAYRHRLRIGPAVEDGEFVSIRNGCVILRDGGGAASRALLPIKDCPCGAVGSASARCGRRLWRARS